jgi:hypothetical protein
MNRLKIKCNNEKFKFKINDTHDSKIDCFINNHKIQCKTTSVKSTNKTYKCTILKSGGSGTLIPYSYKDNIDFFVIEIVGYNNFFFIIPINDLIHNGYISTESNKGKRCISIINPTLKSKHWTKQYINRFDLLQ